MIVYHTGKVGRRVVGINSLPRPCVCEMESYCVCVWGGWVGACVRLCGGWVGACVCDMGSSVADVI